MTQNVVPAKLLRTENTNLWSGHHWRMSLHVKPEVRISMRHSKLFIIANAQYNDTLTLIL